MFLGSVVVLKMLIDWGLMLSLSNHSSCADYKKVEYIYICFLNFSV